MEALYIVAGGFAVRWWSEHESTTRVPREYHESTTRVLDLDLYWVHVNVCVLVQYRCTYSKTVTVTVVKKLEFYVLNHIKRVRCKMYIHVQMCNLWLCTLVHIHVRTFHTRREMELLALPVRVQP